MQSGISSISGVPSGKIASIAVPVALGATLSMVLRLLFGISSAIPICISLAIAIAKEASSVEQSTAQQSNAHAREVQRLNAALKRQQEEHLAVIRKMKLEQNQVLLKCHELEMSLRQ